MGQIQYTLKLFDVKCIDQTDSPELTENDEIFFVTSTTKVVSGIAGETSTAVFPSNKEYIIATGESNIVDTVISSGAISEGETNMLNVAMWENDESTIFELVNTIASVMGKIFPSGSAKTAAQLVSDIAGGMQVIAANRGSQFLGNFTLQIDHGGLIPICRWTPGPGLKILFPYPEYGTPTAAGWHFQGDTNGKYTSSFYITSNI